jgi:hypothetical protein
MPHFHQGKFRPQNPAKYEGDPTAIVYRSSWEKRFLTWCDVNPAIVKYSSEEIVIPYRCPTDGKIHRYFPDAKITVRESNGQLRSFLIEIKPDAQTRQPVRGNKSKKTFIHEVFTWGKNSAKWEAAENYCKDRGISFMLITEYELGLAKRDSKGSSVHIHFTVPNDRGQQGPPIAALR